MSEDFSKFIRDAEEAISKKALPALTQEKNLEKNVFYLSHLTIVLFFFLLVTLGVYLYLQSKYNSSGFPTGQANKIIKAYITESEHSEEARTIAKAFSDFLFTIPENPDKEASDMLVALDLLQKEIMTIDEDNSLTELFEQPIQRPDGEVIIFSKE